MTASDETDDAASFEAPSSELVEGALARLGNLQHRRAFFEGLQNPLWVKPLDATLMEHGLIDEFHLLLTPVAIGQGQHMFEAIETAPALALDDVTQMASGVVRLVYTPT